MVKGLPFRDLTDAEIIRVRTMARRGASPEEAMAAVSISGLAKSFRNAMRRRHGISFDPSRNLAHAGKCLERIGV